jgi:hypothetical protein
MSDVSLSSLHAMLGRIERETDAHRFNRIANDPAVDRFVRGYIQGRMDFTPAVANPNNVLLMGEHGGVLFHQFDPTLYEAHTIVLPEGRGAWTVAMVNAALHWMFTRTHAMEIFTKVPRGNKGALGLVRAIHGDRLFTRKDGWVMDLDPIPADIYGLHVTDWLQHGPGLAERGAWFHRRLEAEYARHGRIERPHDDDSVHDRYVGAAVEMIFGGQPHKGVLLYNRWAVMAGYTPVQIVGGSPLTIDIRDAILIVRDNDFWVATCQQAQSSEA